MENEAIQQRAKLHSQIWKMADDVRGAVDGWDFKQYVLGTLFYRFISENFAAYVEGDTEIKYADYDKAKITPEIKDGIIKTKGYFIYPEQLFSNVEKRAADNPNLNIDLSNIFKAIEASAIGYESENDIKGLFASFDITDAKLGNTVEEKNQRLAKVLNGVASLDFGDYKENDIDLLGDAYEYLISNYAANAGKSGGEFFTPQSVSKLLAKIALQGKKEINKIYDPACGSGSLLLQARKIVAKEMIKGYHGQDINLTTSNLARMNMFLHNVNYSDFEIVRGDTLLEPQLKEVNGYDAIVSNPPYSIKWKGTDDPLLLSDKRFSPAGVLAPKDKADFAFVMHSLHYLSARGRAAIVCFPGIFYRGGAEQKIRQYLIDNGYVESVIALPKNLFFGTSIAVNVLVLAKNKVDPMKTQFIDATELYKKETNNNTLTDEHIDKILEVFTSKEEIEHFSAMVDYSTIKNNDFNLSVSTYVEPEDTREVIDIDELNGAIKSTVNKITDLREGIERITEELASNQRFI